MIVEKRIGDLKFEKLNHAYKESEHPTYGLNVYIPNRYYGHKDDYVKVDDSYYMPKENQDGSWKIHEDCFKNPEVSYVISEWVWDNHEECYEYSWIRDRPKRYYENHGDETYKRMVDYGFRQLNPYWYGTE